MAVPSYTVVVGVDQRHLNELALVLPTWKKNKPSLFTHPFVLFYDRDSLLDESIIRSALPDLPDSTTVVPFPSIKVTVDYYGKGLTKWDDPQRVKMLSGFVFIPPLYVKTPYWLKLDTDCVASQGFESQDEWARPEWFNTVPSIIAHPWSVTKPADQMLILDKWVTDLQRDNKQVFKGTDPLNLYPVSGENKIHHKRIISWCGFFHTSFTRHCASLALIGSHLYRLPVGSQDGYMWYCAKRMGLDILPVNMKACGWEHWGNFGNLKAAVERALCK